jgi:ribosomal protein S8
MYAALTTQLARLLQRHGYLQGINYRVHQTQIPIELPVKGGRKKVQQNNDNKKVQLGIIYETIKFYTT